MNKMIVHHYELDIYKIGLEAGMKIFEISKTFPKEEKYSLTDQIRRSSRSVCANIAEAWRKRRYEAAFVSKLNDAESEAAETQTWIQFAVKCAYIEKKEAEILFREYDKIIAKLVIMINNPKPWILHRAQLSKEKK